MTTGLWIAVAIVCAFLLVLFIVSGVWAPKLLIGGYAKEDLLEGYVVFQSKRGSLIRFNGDCLGWSEVSIAPDTTVLITFALTTSDPSVDGEVEPVQNVFSMERALLDQQGQKAFVVRRITDDVVICQAEDEVLLVECSTGDQVEANQFDENRQLYLTIRKEGVRMVPLCEVVKS